MQVPAHRVVDIVAAGGFPEARTRSSRRQDRWFRDYLDSTLDRDLRDVSDALKLAEMPRLLRLLAAQAAGLLNYKAAADRLQGTRRVSEFHKAH